ncbi:MAG: hypothetical protein ACYS9Y_10335 [Planctomycetota bacterium]
MNRRQKIAWFQLTVVGIVAVVSVILMALFLRKYEYEFVEAWWIGSCYPTPLLVLTALAPVFIRKKKGQIDFDERDLIIDRYAAWIAFGTTYLFFILVCFMTWVAAGFDKLIPAYWLMRIVLGGWVTAVVVHALTTLFCYGRGSKGEIL